MSRGFTLLEVVVALLLLEVAVLAAVGTLVVASRALRDAEHLERAVVAAEGVLDSLASAPAGASGARAFDGGTLEWDVDAAGLVVLRASNPGGAPVLEITSTLSLP